jgi:hypothetical protein
MSTGGQTRSASNATLRADDNRRKPALTFREDRMQNLWRNNGLSIVLFTLFLIFLVAQSVAGHREYQETRREHGEAPIGYRGYLRSGHFVEATFENWESEFLQMAAYVLLTVFLRQKGSSESKGLTGREAVDADPRKSRSNPRAPGPVRKGGLVLTLYENSLSLAFLLLFGLSFLLHAVGGVVDYNEEQISHGAEPVSLSTYVSGSRFWFESFQNWQSEFLAVGGIVVLSIFLRQKGSPESKPVAAPHGETGSG